MVCDQLGALGPQDPSEWAHVLADPPLRPRPATSLFISDPGFALCIKASAPDSALATFAQHSMHGLNQNRMQNALTGGTAHRLASRR